MDIGISELFGIWCLEFGISLAMLRPMVKKSYHHNNSHTPVLLEHVVGLLEPKPHESYLDFTAGYGGHASQILARTGDESKLTLVDRDEHAISYLKTKFSKKAHLIHSDFVSAATELLAKEMKFDMILLDLGVSSPHLDNASRGFSFQTDAPLDMRMDNRQQLTAKTVVNKYSEDELKRIIKEYGEEPKAKKIAQAIVENRPINSTVQLAAIVEKIYGRRGKIHPATRTFQALRIAVNQELTQLETVLPLLPALLEEGGRVAVISFHSLEDRLVKRFFKEQEASGFEAELKLLTKKPVSGAIDDVLNRRARSAMLRAAIKINI